MTKIGLRNIKTAISVFICLLIYFIIILICYAVNKSLSSSFRKATQLYTPFFACLATAYSVSTNREKSHAQGRLRFLSSLIGGVFGLIIVSLYQLTGHDWPFQHISATGNPTSDKAGFFETGFLAGDDFTESDITWEFLASFIIPILLITLATILIIWFCNQIKKKECCFIAVLTLTAVTASLGTNPVIYGPNRILSTMIGIGVALLVNGFRLPYKKNKNASFAFSLDGLIDSNTQELSGYTVYNINHMISHNMDLYLYSTRSPRVLASMLSEINVEKPLICMSGACIYDLKEKKYLSIERIDNDIALKFSNRLNELNINPFVLTIDNDIIHISIKELTNNGQISYASIRRNATYVILDLAKEVATTDIVNYVIVDKKDVILKLREQLEREFSDLIFQVYNSYDNNSSSDEYLYLKVYSKNITNFKSRLNNDKVLYGFGVLDTDTNLLNNVDYSYTTNEACDLLKECAKEVLTNRVEVNRCLYKKALKINRTNKNNK